MIQRAGALILCRPYQGKNGVFDYQLLMMEQKVNKVIGLEFPVHSILEMAALKFAENLVFRTE